MKARSFAVSFVTHKIKYQQLKKEKQKHSKKGNLN